MEKGITWLVPVLALSPVSPVCAWLPSSATEPLMPWLCRSGWVSRFAFAPPVAVVPTWFRERSAVTRVPAPWECAAAGVIEWVCRVVQVLCYPFIVPSSAKVPNPTGTRDASGSRNWLLPGSTLPL